MNIRKYLSFSLLMLAALVGCNDDDDESTGDNSLPTGRTLRVKTVAGENKIWGKYELDFNYRPDGRLDRVWRLDGENRQDTVGSFYVEYDVDYTNFLIYDYVTRIDADSIAKLQAEFPDSYRDTLRSRRSSQLLYSVERTRNNWTQTINRPRRNVGHGDHFNYTYMRKTKHLQRLERTADGRAPLVIRINDDTYGEGGENREYTTGVCKYEFVYNGGSLTSIGCFRPDSFEESSWRKEFEMACNSWSGILVSVDSDGYKMRRSGRKVVVAEPGRNITYTLNEEGLAVSMLTTDGETATVTYEQGCGNFSELYAMPLDEALGKIWIR